jgi:phosphate transport system protein
VDAYRPLFTMGQDRPIRRDSLAASGTGNQGERMQLAGHISKAFDGQLSTLHIQVLEMGGLVVSQAQEAAQAYSLWEDDAARRVIEREPAVNQYRRNIESGQVALIARRAPVAGDLRAVIALSRIVAELERAGDESKKIARSVLTGSPRPGSATTGDVRHLGHMAVSVLRLSLAAVQSFDARLACETEALDADLDAEYWAGSRRLLSRVMDDARCVEAALEAAFVLKSLERIGDHGRNIARHVSLVSGQRRASAQAAGPDTGHRGQ